jgi:hypothetical protein
MVFFDPSGLRTDPAGIRKFRIQVAAATAERPRCTIRANLKDPKNGGEASVNYPKLLEIFPWTALSSCRSRLQRGSSSPPKDLHGRTVLGWHIHCLCF